MFVCFDQQLENSLAYCNFNAVGGRLEEKIARIHPVNQCSNRDLLCTRRESPASRGIV